MPKVQKSVISMREKIISEIINETGAESLKDMGAVMGKLKQQADGKIDMKLASDIVRESLSDIGYTDEAKGMDNNSAEVRAIIH